MKQVLQHVRSRTLEVADVPAPGCRPGGVLVLNAVSLLSAGTERMVTEFASKSLLEKARERPDLVRQVLDKVKRDGVLPTARAVISRLDQPLPLGYSCAGTVLEVGDGVPEFSAGHRVACAGMGYASHADVVYVPRNLAVAIPDKVSFEDASYVTVGAIALQGVRIAEPRLGDAIAIIGLGLLGQLTVQLLRAHGCRVIAIDLDPAKVALARSLGADVAITREEDVEGAVSAFTGGAGADGVLIAAATDSNDPIELAGTISRDRAVVTIVGAVGMNVPRKVFYEKELQLRLSRSYGPGRYDPSYEERGQDYPIGYVRWTERRNMQEFLRLVATGAVTPSALTTHRFPIERGQEAYTLIGGTTREQFTGVLLTYESAATRASQRTLRREPVKASRGTTGIGFIGAGNFARAILLPRFSKQPGARFVSVVTASGVTAKSVADKFGFASCGTDTEAVLADPDVDAVVIATRHGSHARLAARALRAGKAVFVEKPLAVDAAQLDDVLDAHASSERPLMVGFNRRFSPLAAEMKGSFTAGAPLAINYRVNAGAVPASSWLHDGVEGGGRVIGEVCHFVDLIQFLTGELPVEVYAASVGAEATLDTLSITTRWSGGSVATISYFATGDKSFSKERVEVYAGGTIAVLDDWQSLEVVRGGKCRRRRLLIQDKGYDGEIAAFLQGVRSGTSPVSIESLEATTRATFAMLASVREGRAVAMSSTR